MVVAAAAAAVVAVVEGAGVEAAVVEAVAVAVEAEVAEVAGVNVSSRPGLSGFRRVARELVGPRRAVLEADVSERPWSASTPKRILITSLPSSKIASKLALPERFA